jgi:hypothetical protein
MHLHINPTNKYRPLKLAPNNLYFTVLQKLFLLFFYIINISSNKNEILHTTLLHFWKQVNKDINSMKGIT